MNLIHKDKQLRKAFSVKRTYTYPVSKREAFPRMPWKVSKDCSPVTIPAATCQSLVSNLPAVGVLDHMIGTRPRAKEIARTRSSLGTESARGIRGCIHNFERTNVSLGRTHGCGSNSKDLPDSLTSESELGDDLLIGEGCEKSVRPGVYADFMAGHVFFDQYSWPLNYARADNEEGSRDIYLVEVFEQFSTKYPESDV